MSLRLRWVAFLLLVTGQTAAQDSRAPAEDASASAMYSHGVHGYFSGNLNRAEMYLQRATELNPNDPRPYYFRGLALMRLGRSDEAQVVFQQGAAVEASPAASAYNIGEALARVQGGDRQRLERARRQAQSQPTNSVADRRRLRSEQFERRQATVQRKPIHMPLEALINPIEPGQVAALSAAAGQESVVDSTTETLAAEATTETSDELAPASEGDPFADDPIAEAATAETAGPAGGGVKAGSMLGIFGRMGRKAAGNLLPGSDVVEKARGMIPGAGGGNVPPVTPEGFEGTPPAQGENPFGEAAETGEGGTPPATDAENPFDQ